VQLQRGEKESSFLQKMSVVEAKTCPAKAKGARKTLDITIHIQLVPK
jgi:hypothetical protein